MAFADTAQLAVHLTLDDKFSRQIRTAGSSLNKFEGSVKRVGKGVGQVGAGFARAGLITGGAIVTGLAAAAKTAIDFQDAFAGVQKTVAGTPAELEGLNKELRALSTRIPVDFSDLAGIAQEAGALGVPTKNVAGFTEVVARLSAATVGLTASAAAEAFGKLGNVLRIKTVVGFERLGSALVALGNAGASSEGDIVAVAQRFGAAGAQAKLSAAQVLGFSSAIASMGVEPEAAGSSLSRLFNNITKYLGTGDKKAKAFAKVVGVSVKKFKTLFAKDASGAVQTFLTKLSKLDRFKAANVLKAAGITNVRDINAVLLLARGHDELARQIDLSTEAYRKNTELTDVSAKRFDTIKNKLIQFKNQIKLAAVTLAEGFLPALGRTVEKLGKFLSDPANQAALKNLGEDIGKGIDSINWQDVLDGGKKLVGFAKDAFFWADKLFKAFNALPGPVKDMAAAFVITNKLSGGLIGTGVGNIAGGLGESITRAAGSKLPGPLGKLFVQPVFVTNFPTGFGGPGVPAAAGGGGLLAALGSAGFLGAISVAVNKANESNQAIAEIRANSFGQTAGVAFEHTLAGILARVRANNRPQPAHDLLDNGARQGLLDQRHGEQGGVAAAVKSIPTGLQGLHQAVATGDTNIHSAVAAGATGTQGAVRGAAQTISGAIHASRPIITVGVHIQAYQVTKSVTIQERYGAGNGSNGQPAHDLG